MLYWAREISRFPAPQPLRLLLLDRSNVLDPHDDADHLTGAVRSVHQIGRVDVESIAILRPGHEIGANLSGLTSLVSIDPAGTRSGNVADRVVANFDVLVGIDERNPIRDTVTNHIVLNRQVIGVSRTDPAL